MFGRYHCVNVKNLTQSCFENTFHSKSLPKTITHCQEHKYSMHPSVIHCTLKSMWRQQTRIKKHKGKCKCKHKSRNVMFGCHVLKWMKKIDILIHAGNTKYFQMQAKNLG
jgi:hypothetical protein